MTFLLILFFGSLLGISFMLGQKLMVLASHAHRHKNISGVDFEIPHLEALTTGTTKELKRYGYVTLVMTMKMYVKSSNLIQEQYNNLVDKIKTARNKNMSSAEIQAAEQKVSKFLEMISDYKHKIRKIKHQITEEERNL